MPPSTERDRQRLRAANQAVFREVNDRIAEISRHLADGRDGTLDLLCECSRTDCAERIELESREYQAVRASDDTFVVRPGHGDDDIEDVIRTNERFSVVQLRR